MYLSIVVMNDPRGLRSQMQQSASTYEIPAQKLGFRDERTPRRLLIVPQLDVIANVAIPAGCAPNVTWDLFLLREVMEWSDLLGAEGGWSRVVVAAEGFETMDVIGIDYEHAWQAWVAYINSVQLMRWQNQGLYSAEFGYLGDDALDAGAAFYDQRHFNQWNTTHEAWKSILRQAIPGCSVLSCATGNGSIFDLFEEGRVRRNPAVQDSPEEVVILSRTCVNGELVITPRAFALPHR